MTLPCHPPAHSRQASPRACRLRREMHPRRSQLSGGHPQLREFPQPQTGSRRHPLPPRASGGAQGSSSPGGSAAPCSRLGVLFPVSASPHPPCALAPPRSPPLCSDTCCPPSRLSTPSPLIPTPLSWKTGNCWAWTQAHQEPDPRCSWEESGPRCPDLGSETPVPTPGLWLRPQKAGTAAGRPAHRPPYARSSSLWLPLGPGQPGQPAPRAAGLLHSLSP